MLCKNNGKRAKLTLSTLFVPDCGKNLITMSKFKKSIRLEFGDNDQIVTRDGTVFPLMQENHLFRWNAKFINCETQNEFCNEQCLASSNLNPWHDRLGHI